MSNATYNDLGKLFDLSLGNGLTTSYRYWGLNYGGNAHYGLLRSIVTGSLQSLTYDYDNEGNVTSLVDGRTSESITFGYDHLDRLTSASAPLSESYAYDNIGRMTTRNTTGYDYTGTPHIHAPRYVGGNFYDYDNNGNLISAEGRTYSYDIENRLVAVLESGQTILSHSYDGDGALRSLVRSGQTTHYATPDYHVNLATGEITVYYRFGGRAVAWRNNSGLRYLLSDHLSSTHGEASENQAEMGQRRFYPFGSDRAVPGANDVTDEERFTSQRRIDSGGGNARKELYYYGARWYLSGVGIFTQPDTIVPNPKNPQALNRYAYVYNNPLKNNDPTGNTPNPLDWINDAWKEEFRTAHNGADPGAADYLYRLASMAGASGTSLILVGLEGASYQDGGFAVEESGDVGVNFLSDLGAYSGGAAAAGPVWKIGNYRFEIEPFRPDRGFSLTDLTSKNPRGGRLFMYHKGPVPPNRQVVWHVNAEEGPFARMIKQLGGHPTLGRFLGGVAGEVGTVLQGTAASLQVVANQAALVVNSATPPTLPVIPQFLLEFSNPYSPYYQGNIPERL